MRMQRRILVSCMTILTVMTVFTGCGNGENTKTVDKKNETAITNEKKEEQHNEQNQGSLNMLTDNAFQASYGTEKGWYYFNEEYQLEENDIPPAIMYVDYQSGKNIYLCNKVNCKHNSYDCNAVLPKEMDRERTLFGQGEYLYLVSSDIDDSGSMSSQMLNLGEDENGNVQVQEEKPYVPAIYRMKLDGTEREKVMNLESGTVLESTFLGDGENLYGVQKKVKKETKGANSYSTGYDKMLVKIDMKNKKTEKIMDLDEETTIIGCAGRNIVTGTIDYGRKVTTEEKHANDDLYKQATYIIKSVNIDTKKEVILKKIKEKNIHREMVCGSHLYTSGEKEKKIEIIDFLTGKKSVIKTDIPLSVDNIIERENGFDVLYCIGYDYEEDQGWDYYLVDTKTKKTIKGKLKNSENTPVEIVAQTSDKLFVTSDYKNVNEYVAWMDVNQEVIGEMEYSMISKDDYIRNKANLKKVKMIGMKK